MNNFDFKRYKTTKYSRDSFERFGDDLCEELLSRLSLKQCFGCECVNSQWKRVVFKPVKRLHFCDKKCTEKITSFTTTDINQFECVTKKCPLITDIVIDSSHIDSIIDIITRNCGHVRRVVFRQPIVSLSEKNCQLFGQTCGPGLEKLAINCAPKLVSRVKQLLYSTASLTECEINRLCDVVWGHDCEPLLPDLKSIAADIAGESDLQLFANQYSKRVEKIKLRIDTNLDFTDRQMSAMFAELSRFESLDELSLDFNLKANVDRNVINSGLSLIGESCRRLRFLCLTGLDNISNYWPDFGSKMLGLKRFKYSCRVGHLSYFNLSYLDTNLKSLSLCPNLERLDIEISRMSDTNFDNIEAFAPNLSVVLVRCHRDLTEKTLQNFAKLKKLVAIKMECNYINISDSGLAKFIKDSVNVRRVDLCRVPIDGKRAINALISRAKLNPKYQYSLKIVRLYDRKFLKKDFLKHTIQNLPNNVDVDISQ